MAIKNITTILISPIVSAITSPPFLSNMFGRVVMAMGIILPCKNHDIQGF